MKIKKISAVVLAAFITLSLSGCSLAKEEMQSPKAKDRLIGLFITREHLDLFDTEAYLNDNLNNLTSGAIPQNGTTEKYNGRLYAKLVTKELTDEETGEKSSVQEYAFEGVEGVNFFAADVKSENGEAYTSTISDISITDGHFGVYSGDDEDKITLEGKILTVPDNGRDAHYFNPVYQSSDGKVYTVTGQGMSVVGGNSVGGVMTQKLEETITVTANGESKKKTTTINFSVESQLPPYKIAVLQMDKNSSLLENKEYLPGKLPVSINALKDTEYIIVETYKNDYDNKQTVSRVLYDKQAEQLESFYEGENNIIIKQFTNIIW